MVDIFSRRSRIRRLYDVSVCKLHCVLRVTSPIGLTLTSPLYVHMKSPITNPSEPVPRARRTRASTHSSQSSTTSSQSSQSPGSHPSTDPALVVTQTQYSIVSQAKCKSISVPGTKGRSRSSSSSSSSTTTMGNAPRASSRSLGTNPTDEHPRTAHQKSSKSVETGTLRIRSEKTEHDHRHTANRCASTLDPIQPGVGKSKQAGETILMPLVCLLSIQVAQRTHPEVFAAAKRIVLKLTINQSQVQGFVRITPVGFSMKTNLVESAAAFLPRATKNLQDWETILGPGVIDQLARRYSIPDLGDQIYELLGTTQVFKRRKEEEGNVTRDMSTFPRVKCAPQPPVNLPVSPLSDNSPGIPGPPSLLQLQHPQTPQRNWPDGRLQQGDKTITYAQALTNSSQTHMSSMVPSCAPTHDTPQFPHFLEHPPQQQPAQPSWRLYETP